MKEWKKCNRCKEEYERIYHLPYLTKQYIYSYICFNCTMKLHDSIDGLIKKFMSDDQILKRIDKEYGTVIYPALESTNEKNELD